MINKKKVIIETAIVVTIIIALIGAISLTGFYVYNQFSIVNSSGIGLNNEVALKFITTEAKMPVNNTSP
jgi:hypothetical protein